MSDKKSQAAAVQDTVRPAEDAAATRIRVEGEMTIYRAADLKPEFVPLPGASAPIEVDLGDVSEIDTAGVQLLLLAHRDAAAAGRTLRLTATSPAVDDALRLLGLHSQFGLPLAA